MANEAPTIIIFTLSVQFLAKKNSVTESKIIIHEKITYHILV